MSVTRDGTARACVWPPSLPLLPHRRALARCRSPSLRRRPGGRGGRTSVLWRARRAHLSAVVSLAAGRSTTIAGTQRRGLRPELMILLLLVVAVPIIGWQIYRRVTFQFNELVTALTAHPCAYVYKDKKEYDLSDLSRSKSTCSTYDAVRLRACPRVWCLDDSTPVHASVFKHVHWRLRAACVRMRTCFCTATQETCQDYHVHRVDNDFFFNVCNNAMRKPPECSDLFGLFSLSLSLSLSLSRARSLSLSLCHSCSLALVLSLSVALSLSLSLSLSLAHSLLVCQKRHTNTSAVKRDLLIPVHRRFTKRPSLHRLPDWKWGLFFFFLFFSPFYLNPQTSKLYPHILHSKH